jgi:hypothetical protein
VVKLYFGEAVGLLMKTLPFVWLRLVSYLVFGLVLTLYFAALFGIAWLLGSLWAPLGVIVFVAAAGGAWGMMNWASKYYFYLLKAAHTAVMTEFIVHGRGPAGSQVAYGKAQVMNRFKDTSIMFAVDSLLDGIVDAFNRQFANIAQVVPIPGMDSLVAIVQRIAKYATTFVDEAILSRAYRQQESNVWRVAQDGVILYAQAWKPILANAVVLALLSYAEFLVFLIVLSLPALVLGTLLPALSTTLGISALVLAWMLKLAIADALSLAATLVAYHRATEGMVPSPEWKARLETASDKFRELTRKAAVAVTPEPAPAAESTAPIVAPEAL